MRAPLSWLRDFAPFEGAPEDLVATLDDLGLVVEGIEHVGEGLEDVVVAEVREIAAIQGADRIRRVVVWNGEHDVEVVCGATNFAVSDLVPLAPVGAVLPGGFEIGQRKMKGVVSNGMLCSGRELEVSTDGEGLLVVTEVEGARPGVLLAELLGIERDVVFDITVEGNRPDAWCIAGIARDLAARLGLSFTLPGPMPALPVGPPVGELATASVADPDLCPRLTATVLTGVSIAPSPRWLARRLTLAGMRPINNVVDASNYVMLELGQPTHPYDLDALPGHGLLVRRATPGEVLTTLDGVDRTLGIPGPGLGDTGVDCVICDGEGTPVGIGGIMGGASSEISETTTRVLLEAAFFTPMVIARTSKRLALRTEASARFERGCDPWGIDRATRRFAELLLASVPDLVVAEGSLDVRGDVAGPIGLELEVARVNDLLGLALDAEDVARLIEPLGFGAEPSDDASMLTVTVPTNRPDVRPAPEGQADVIEEVARIYGYARLPRRHPAWPQVGAVPTVQRERARLREASSGLGAYEAWTPTFLAEADHRRIGLEGPSVMVANPLVNEEASLRRTMLPGLLRALAYNADRRQGDIRLFEIGTVFSHPTLAGRAVARAGAGGASAAVLPGERELLSMVLAEADDDARSAVVAWGVLAETVGVTGVRLVAIDGASGPVSAGLHPTRAALLVAQPSGAVIGAVGEVDPDTARQFGLATPSGTVARIGWLEVDLGLLLDPEVVARRASTSTPVSRFPSSDVDLALVVPDHVPADEVAGVLVVAGGDLLESVELFDVFRGDSLAPGTRSLAFRLRFCALDRTLTDAEVGALRQGCIDATGGLGAILR